jgi:hypothetical protein
MWLPVDGRQGERRVIVLSVERLELQRLIGELVHTEVARGHWLANALNPTVPSVVYTIEKAAEFDLARIEAMTAIDRCLNGIDRSERERRALDRH